MEGKRDRRPRRPSGRASGTQSSVSRANVVELVYPRRTPASVLEKLTPTEIQVAEALVAGESTSRIASARGTSANTVTNQITSIFRKLNVASRAELVRAWCGSGPVTVRAGSRSGPAHSIRKPE